MNLESLHTCYVCGEFGDTNTPKLPVTDLNPYKTCDNPEIAIWWNNILRQIEWSNDIDSMLEGMGEIDHFINYEIPFHLVSAISIQYSKADIIAEMNYKKCILDAVSKEIHDWYMMSEEDQSDYLNNLYKHSRIDCKSTNIRGIRHENMFISPDMEEIEEAQQALLVQLQFKEERIRKLASLLRKPEESSVVKGKEGMLNVPKSDAFLFDKDFARICKGES
jgi:hypothetical protein